MTAMQLCEAAGLKHPHTAMLEPAGSAPKFVDALIGGGHHIQAILYLAHAIPAREGILWAWAMIKKLPPPLAPEALPALAAVESWIRDSSNENRLICKQAATVLPPDGAMATLCDAVFFTGNLGDPGGHPVPAPAFSSSKFAGACLILCACQADPQNPTPHFAVCLRQGLEVAQRIKLWDTIKWGN